ncbi:hypothetical protein G5B40_01565 [Pikeienuella piscinae]|uniref:Lipoprotein n=1 Tax=Pikeienuella piscinae TaxID=2748098 RepID=A0A7L5BTT1_9RHOB|nr:hypothetical protein [Pikeienuella piscinae]QIE54243.1 hypothetical protein G5B40_01565 [Pikeienuella piscinae]
MIRAAFFSALTAAALAGCAAPRAEAPAPTPPVAPGLTVTDAAAGVIRVAGSAVDEDALAAHHCAAAKHARAAGAGALEWVGGVAKRDAIGDGVDADLVYQTMATAGAPVKGAPPAEGRAAAVEDWLIYCDEAGVAREGEA